MLFAEPKCQLWILGWLTAGVKLIVWRSTQTAFKHSVPRRDWHLNQWTEWGRGTLPHHRWAPASRPRAQTEHEGVEPHIYGSPARVPASLALRPLDLGWATRLASPRRLHHHASHFPVKYLHTGWTFLTWKSEMFQNAEPFSALHQCCPECHVDSVDADISKWEKSWNLKYFWLQGFQIRDVQPACVSMSVCVSAFQIDKINFF